MDISYHLISQNKGKAYTPQEDTFLVKSEKNTQTTQLLRFAWLNELVMDLGLNWKKKFKKHLNFVLTGSLRAEMPRNWTEELTHLFVLLRKKSRFHSFIHSKNNNNNNNNSKEINEEQLDDAQVVTTQTKKKEKNKNVQNGKGTQTKEVSFWGSAFLTFIQKSIIPLSKRRRLS